MTISLRLLAKIQGTLSTSGDGGEASLTINEGATIDFDQGDAADQAEAVYIDDFSIAASGTLDIDLSGALEDRLGNSVVFVAVKALLVVADSGNTNNVVIGGDAAAIQLGFGNVNDTWAVKPGGVFLAGDGSAGGWAVTNTTADILQLANSSSGSAVTGTIVIVGEV